MTNPVSSPLLFEEFMEYRRDHPELRFWQALRNWSGHDAILAKNGDQIEDTFFRLGQGKEDDA